MINKFVSLCCVLFLLAIEVHANGDEAYKAACAIKREATVRNEFVPLAYYKLLYSAMQENHQGAINDIKEAALDVFGPIGVYQIWGGSQDSDAEIRMLLIHFYPHEQWDAIKR